MCNSAARDVIAAMSGLMPPGLLVDARARKAISPRSTRPSNPSRWSLTPFSTVRGAAISSSSSLPGQRHDADGRRTHRPAMPRAPASICFYVDVNRAPLASLHWRWRPSRRHRRGIRRGRPRGGGGTMSDDPSKPGDGYKAGYRRPPLATRFVQEHPAIRAAGPRAPATSPRSSPRRCRARGCHRERPS